MKNKFFLILLCIFFYSTNNVLANEIIFETKNINILNDGNRIITDEGIARSINNGLTINNSQDEGRKNITNRENDLGKFRVPTLRNIALTKPYMHDGRFETLQEVIEHYTTGVQKSTTLAKELEDKIILTDKEKIDLLVFLRTLTDKQFLFNKRFSFPKSLLTNTNF